ncbi:MAG: B12-binding domain-containing radical SAM protein, partial [Promethearchaeota archaeon]
MEKGERRIIFLCDLTHTGQKIASDSYPLGIGCISAYVEAYSDVPTYVHMIKFPEKLYEDFVKYQPPIIGFSNYQWNFDLSRSFAKIIKEEFPEIIIIFGGPNFPVEENEKEEFLKKNKMIDFYIEGEGEIAFLSLINKLYSNDFDIEKVKNLPNPSAKTIINNSFISNELAPRIKDYDKVPSPYLKGKMDKFFGKGLMPLFQTTRGCPFTCTYCVEGNSYYLYVIRKSQKSIAAELEYIANRITDNKQMFIADSNFGMYKADVETAKIISNIKEKYGFPYYIHVAMGKNKKMRILEVARILKGKLRLAGSVQSLDPQVLKNVKRQNILTDDLLTLAESAREIDANSYSEIIIGLPGDSYKSFLYTMERVIEAGFNFLTPYTLILLPGSDLASQKNIKKFGLIRKYRILPRCFGKYNFGVKEFISGEVEEVCVGNDTMPIKDYVKCRLFTLTTALFYNDRIFEEVIETLKSFDISTFRWMYQIHNAKEKFPKKLNEIYEGFEKDTLNELWDSKEELENFIKTPENIEKYIKGELGYNIMFFYRSKALISCMKELNDFAFEIAFELIQEKNPELFNKNIEYLEELKQFSFLRKVDLFDIEKRVDFSFSYDFKEILLKGLWNFEEALRTKGTFLYSFYHLDDQKHMIQEQMNVFG